MGAGVERGERACHRGERCADNPGPADDLGRVETGNFRKFRIVGNRAHGSTRLGGGQEIVQQNGDYGCRDNRL